MHLLESYAVVTGTQIDKCFIYEEEIVLPSKKYITFHGHNPKGPNRQYRYWQDVIDILLKNKINYEIVQIGGKEDTKYKDININYLGKTSYNSLAYLIKNAKLHLGFDSLPVHLASHYNKKIVAIYAHYVNSTRPYFSDLSDVILIEPDFSIYKPVFSNKDPYDLINTINPEYVAAAVLELLSTTDKN